MAQSANKPTCISCKTIIGYGSPNKSNTSSVHGSPLGKNEINLVRKKLGWEFKPFEIPKNILGEWRNIGNIASKKAKKQKFNLKKNNYSKKISKIIKIEK